MVHSHDARCPRNSSHRCSGWYDLSEECWTPRHTSRSFPSFARIDRIFHLSETYSSVNISHIALEPRSGNISPQAPELVLAKASLLWPWRNRAYSDKDLVIDSIHITPSYSPAFCSRQVPGLLLGYIQDIDIYMLTTTIYSVFRYIRIQICTKK